jgi:hypothetical protein
MKAIDDLLKHHSLEKEVDLRDKVDLSRDSFKRWIDKHGLRGPAVLERVGKLQRSLLLKPGIHKKLRELDEKLAGPAKPKVTVEMVKKTENSSMKVVHEEVGEEIVESFVGEERGAEDADIEGTGGDSAEGLVFSNAENNRIEEKLRRDEEKHQRRQDEKKKKLLEAAARRMEAKSKKLGLKVEEMNKINELKAKIKNAQEQRKTLQEQIATWKKELEEIKPTPQAKSDEPPTTKPKPKPTSSQSNGVSEEHISKIREFLSEKPGTNSKGIIEATGLPEKPCKKAILKMKKNGEIIQKGRGPFIEYYLESQEK